MNTRRNPSFLNWKKRLSHMISKVPSSPKNLRCCSVAKICTSESYKRYVDHLKWPLGIFLNMWHESQVLNVKARRKKSQGVSCLFQAHARPSPLGTTDQRHVRTCSGRIWELTKRWTTESDRPMFFMRNSVSVSSSFRTSRIRIPFPTHEWEKNQGAEGEIGPKDDI